MAGLDFIVLLTLYRIICFVSFYVVFVMLPSCSVIIVLYRIVKCASISILDSGVVILSTSSSFERFHWSVKLARISHGHRSLSLFVSPLARPH